MAFFKLRKAAGEPPAPAPAPESADALRKRARYRLAGAGLLVLVGVIGFPLLFDNQPRPIAVDIPIDIPDKAKVQPLGGSPMNETRRAESAVPFVPTPSAVPLQASAKESKPQQKEEVIISTSKPATLTTPKAEDKHAAKTDSKPEAKAKASEKPTDKATPTDKAAANGRFIVQFGAFSDSARAHEARLKAEKAGLKTYAQVVDGADGKKYRVRVGPFEKRSDAEKAAEKIKKLDLPASILEL
jgi:DedD protein